MIKHYWLNISHTNLVVNWRFLSNGIYWGKRYSYRTFCYPEYSNILFWKFIFELCWPHKFLHAGIIMIKVISRVCWEKASIQWRPDLVTPFSIFILREIYRLALLHIPRMELNLEDHLKLRSSMLNFPLGWISPFKFWSWNSFTWCLNFKHWNCNLI